LSNSLLDNCPGATIWCFLTKLKERDTRLAYASQALDRGWSRAVLVHHLEARTVERQGKALTNFAERLPKPQSDLARESLKDPYRFDFLGIGDEASEIELEGALVQHITRFLLELGAGFAFVGARCTWRWAVRTFSSTSSSII
jgi:predicted nuclease of restriction endonuclease-like (RecB) superfamily